MVALIPCIECSTGLSFWNILRGHSKCPTPVETFFSSIRTGTISPEVLELSDQRDQMSSSINQEGCKSHLVSEFGTDLVNRVLDILELPGHVLEFQTTDSLVSLFSRDRHEYDLFIRAVTPERINIENLRAMVRVNIQIMEKHLERGRSLLELVNNIYAKVAILTINTFEEEVIFDRFWVHRTRADRKSEITPRIKHFRTLDVLQVYDAVLRDPEMKYITYHASRPATGTLFHSLAFL